MRGDVAGLAEICLASQAESTRGINMDLVPFPNLVTVDARPRQIGFARNPGARQRVNAGAFW